MAHKEFREITAAEALELKSHETPVIRIKTDIDAVPGGLAMAMLPMAVRWDASSAGFGPDDYYIVRNVNTINNPVGGNCILSSVKVFADSVESVEFVTVISKVAKRETSLGHGMLRFIFREDRRALLLGQNGEPFATNSHLDDIVLSWEAWRPPTAGFDPVAGLDPETYALTPRCLAGSVRCLLDSILDRPWHCYPLELPEVEHAANELLYISLVMADAVARHTVANILDQKIEQGRSLPEGYGDPEQNEWQQLADEYRNFEVPEDPIQDILDGRIKYQLLERSCITMALSSIDWANRRIHERGGLGEPRPIRVSPQSMPAFLTQLASGKRATALLRAPAALHWLMTNNKVIPGKAHELLDEVGLLQRENGVIKKFHYDNRRHTPYGEVADHLIY